MTTITLFSAILLILLFSVIFYFVGQYMSSQKNKTLQGKMTAVQAEHDELRNQVKQGKKEINTLSSKNESLTVKYEKIEKKYGPLTAKLEKELAEAKEALPEKVKALDMIKVERDRIENKFTRLEKEHERLKDRYKVDLGDSKDWKNKRDSLLREAVNYKNKAVRGENEIKVLNERLLKEKKSNVEADAIRAKFRKMKSSIQKLTTDVEYWEKKHYDAHHELASTKTKLESLEKGHHELDLLYKGGQIKEQNMLKKIEEFKTKFVIVNNKYNELKTQHEV